MILHTYTFRNNNGDMAYSGQTYARAPLLALSAPVRVLLFLIGRLAKTPDAGAIWPQQSQEGRCLTEPKESETLELTWLLTQLRHFVYQWRTKCADITAHNRKMNRMYICSIKNIFYNDAVQIRD